MELLAQYSKSDSDSDDDIKSDESNMLNKVELQSTAGNNLQSPVISGESPNMTTTDTESKCSGQTSISGSVDFFGLASDDGDDVKNSTNDDDDDLKTPQTTYFVQAQTKRIKCCRMPVVTKTSSACLNASFWDDSEQICSPSVLDWNCAENIWGVPYDADVNNRLGQDNSNMVLNKNKPLDIDLPKVTVCHYQPKRHKLGQNTDSVVNEGCQIVETLHGKPLFYVHHKVAPFVHKKEISNKLPKTVATELPGHGGIVNRIAWCTPEYSHLLLSASMDRTVKIWNVYSPTHFCVQTLRRHEKAIKDATWSSSGRQILSCGYDKTARITDVENG